MVVYKEQTFYSKDYILYLYSVNTYNNIYLKDYALDPIKIEDLKILLRCCALFI